MSFLKQALNYGYDVQDIMDYLGQVNPEFGKRLKQALSLGYSMEEIFQNFNNSFRGGNAKKVAKQMGIDPRYSKNLVFSGEFDPANLTTEAFQPSEKERQLINGLGKAAAIGLGTAAGAALGGGFGSSLGGTIGEKIGDVLSAPTTSGEPIPKETIQQAPQRIEGQSFLGKALEGIDFSSVDKEKRNRVLVFGKKLEEFQNQGIPYEDGKVQKIVRKVRSLIEKKGTVQEELERFKKNYYQKESDIESPKGELIENIKKNKTVLENYLSSIGDISIPAEGKVTKELSPIQGLKSSNVRYADYDPKTKNLQILFGPNSKNIGEIYEYFGVPEEDIQGFLQGASSTSTSGSGKLRAWYQGKNPSLGAAFDKFIKQKDPEGNYKYEYRKIGADQVKDKDLLKIREADKISSISQYVNAFENIFSKAKKQQKREGYKDKLRALQSMSEDEIDFLLDEINSELNTSGKKKFQGGKEKEILRRLQSKVEERLESRGKK